MLRPVPLGNAYAQLLRTSEHVTLPPHRPPARVSEQGDTPRTHTSSGDVFGCHSSGEGRWAGSPQKEPPALGVTTGWD